MRDPALTEGPKARRTGRRRRATLRRRSLPLTLSGKRKSSELVKSRIKST
jgi:hypothetical protein